MGNKIKKIKKIRIHHEGTDTLLYGLMGIVAVSVILWQAFDTKVPFWAFVAILGTVYAIVLNFYRCPIRYFASEENEHADIMITTPDGKDILCRQIAGAVARRIVTYAKEGEDCYIDEHLGFIKLGSRVDVYLPADSEVCVKMGQATTGDLTVIAKLK